MLTVPNCSAGIFVSVLNITRSLLRMDILDLFFFDIEGGVKAKTNFLDLAKNRTAMSVYYSWHLKVTA